MVPVFPSFPSVSFELFILFVSGEETPKRRLLEGEEEEFRAWAPENFDRHHAQTWRLHDERSTWTLWPLGPISVTSLLKPKVSPARSTNTHWCGPTWAHTGKDEDTQTHTFILNPRPHLLHRPCHLNVTRWHHKPVNLSPRHTHTQTLRSHSVWHKQNAACDTSCLVFFILSPPLTFPPYLASSLLSSLPLLLSSALLTLLRFCRLPPPPPYHPSSTATSLLSSPLLFLSLLHLLCCPS